jgi:two-component system, response regulator PdtaR
MNTAMQTALIVDDESLIAMSAADLFQAAGYETIEACSADEAIRQLESNANIAIVFTDIRMPGSMDGLQLAHLVRDRWPPVKILVTSGHHSVRPGDLPAGGLFIQKPYTSRAFTEAINVLSS